MSILTHRENFFRSLRPRLARSIRLIALSILIGILITILVGTAQTWIATSKRSMGLSAFGGQLQSGTWPVTSGYPAWDWIYLSATCGQWFGAVRRDGVGRSVMWSALGSAKSRIQRGKVLPDEINEQVAQWVEDHPWIAGIECLTVGFPVPCFRATYVWGSRVEFDRIDRGKAIEGCDLSQSDADWIAAMLGVAAPQAPKHVLPTHPLWCGVMTNIGVWSLLVFATFRTPCVFRVTRGAWRRRGGRCAYCGYDMRALPGRACPECGAMAG
jgi:hypothetical protein